MQKQLNMGIHEPVVDCPLLDTKIKDEDPLSISQGEDGLILNNINHGGLTHTIKQEFPEVGMTVYQHTTPGIVNGSATLQTPVSLVTHNNATSTLNAPINNNNISNRTLESQKGLVEATLKTLENQSYKKKLLKFQTVLKKKRCQLKNLQKQAQRLKANNERMKQLLKKYKQKQVISESVLKNIAKNSKIANILISHIMTNNK